MTQTDADELNPPPPTEDELRDAIANAPEAPPLSGQGGNDQSQPPPPPPPGAASRGKGEIWDDCPVTPLGVRGDYAYYLDVLGQLRAVKKHEAQTIQSLFGHQIPMLCYNFPQWKKAEDGGFVRAKNRFDQTNASMVMHQAVSECGVFNPDNAVRGVGAWQNDEGKLVYHMGDQILIDGEMKKPGRIGGHIYPAQPTIPHPNAAETYTDPVPEIMRTLETWHWSEADTHPFLALGMIATQMVCGALDWRPVFWLLAPAGAGKSEFQKMIKLLHGDAGLVQSTDATKSGITSKLGQSSLPVAVDELEPGDDRSTKERDIIALARVAASGGEWFRGSADQSGVGGKVYSAFMFSSILIPGIMKTQDFQRLIRLELKPLKKGAAKLNLQPRTWRNRGAILKRLLIERWHTWPERLSVWRHALEEAGVNGRDADNWGTVLAMADMASNEDLPADDVATSWAKKVAFLATADREDTTNDSEAMLLHLMTQPLDPFRRGEQHTIAQWIMAAAGLPGAPTGLTYEQSATAADMAIDLATTRDKANTQLAKIGMRVSGIKHEAQIFIANARIHGLLQVFHGSQWAGGVWAQSVARIPGAVRHQGVMSLAGARSRGWLIPVTAVPGLNAFPADRSSSGGPNPDPSVPSDINDFG